MTRDAFRAYWELLDLVTDYAEGGLRRAHAPAPTPPTTAGGALATAAGTETVAGPDLDLFARLDGEQRRAALVALGEAVRACEKCPLAQTRRLAVPGVGVLDPAVMVIGEAPGADEDRQGEPFVGKAGQFLDKWLAAVDLSRERNVYVTNVVKCRPPGNRDPYPAESAACRSYLEAQIALVRPKIILTLGRIATSLLLDTPEGISRLRGRVFRYRDLPLVPTFHPSAVLRTESLKRPVWEDMKLVRRLVEDASPQEPLI